MRPALVCALASAIACGTRTPGDDEPSREPVFTAQPTALASASASVHDLAPAPAPASTDDAPMPRAYRARGRAAVELNAGCVKCHAAEAAQWRGSHHQRSEKNPAYRAAFAIEPSSFCRGCHAPEGDPRRDPPADVAELGVGCVTCHVTEEGLVLAREPAPGAREHDRAPHALRRSRSFAGAGACAGCHEFRFPAGRGDDERAFMQTTAREHASSPRAGVPCAGCHMPIESGARSHAFANVRDPAWLASSIEVATALDAEVAALTVTLVAPGAGHAIPTGDLFRRLEVGCEVRDPSGKVALREVRWLERHFQVLPGRPGRELVRDDRVTHEPRELEFDLSSAREKAPRGALEVRWWVTYQRVATPGANVDPSVAKVESQVPLRSGKLAWGAR